MDENKTRGKKLKDWWKGVKQGTREFVKENPFVSVAIIGVAGKVAVAAIKNNKTPAVTTTEVRIYDPQLGISVPVKHDLTPAQNEVYKAYLEMGLSRYEALQRMDMLK